MVFIILFYFLVISPQGTFGYFMLLLDILGYFTFDYFLLL
jgi:hypothetical protein